ncbi:hypothetical protein MYE70_00665 [Marinobacter alexandrii]|uniref:hypothetical protein n=1 Tax=Marinobacter alexandrii TaxID=2570351 RepID=UPI002000452A|nr:hypothetical protein [Marinobacter alexandrii]MCK2147569.1 hypothetical protein [Marinobacter alexandrii]
MPSAIQTDVPKPHYTSVFDPQLDQVPIYNQFPSLKPSVGVNYGTNGPKILIIAESHYLPKESKVHRDASTWYSLDHSALSVVGKKKEVEEHWMNTRGILKKKLKKWKQGHAIYRNLENALHEAGVPRSANAFQYVAFMNAFQRPAATGLTIKATQQDISVARETVSSVISILAPDHVIFVSSKARDLVGKKLGIPHASVPHPACPHWNNQKLKKGPGREQFIAHIRRFYAASNSEPQA